MSSLKDKAEKAGASVAETAREVGRKVADGAEKAADFVKEKAGMCGKDVGVARIKERMDVIASCGKKVGVVDHVEGQCLKLTRNDSPDSQHHFIPVNWVEKVDNHVHLKKNSAETERGWAATKEACGCA